MAFWPKWHNLMPTKIFPLYGSIHWKYAKKCSNYDHDLLTRHFLWDGVRLAHIDFDQGHVNHRVYSFKCNASPLHSTGINNLTEIQMVDIPHTVLPSQHILMRFHVMTYFMSQLSWQPYWDNKISAHCWISHVAVLPLQALKPLHAHPAISYFQGWKYCSILVANKNWTSE